MDAEQYRTKLDALNMLLMEDPDPSTDAGKELLALADEVESYEREHFPNMFKRNCDFCGKTCQPNEIDCEEGDQWACFDCDDRWTKEDGGVRKY